MLLIAIISFQLLIGNCQVTFDKSHRDLDEILVEG